MNLQGQRAYRDDNQHDCGQKDVADPRIDAREGQVGGEIHIHRLLENSLVGYGQARENERVHHIDRVGYFAEKLYRRHHERACNKTAVQLENRNCADKVRDNRNDAGAGSKTEHRHDCNGENDPDRRQSAQVTNWMKDVRSELVQIIYENLIYPKNRY